MIYSNVFLTVKDEADVEKVRELLIQQGTLSKQEPGCARFEVYHSKSAPTFFLLIERWETQEDLDRHREAKAFVEIYQPLVLPLVDRVPHASDLVF
ncbi:MAG: antibiotic biosynthesis monooxygenase [Rhodopirellula sp.]|nr:antibiotic biosynthesis monooxygenase [Rhodopirellula sp.]